MEQETYKIKQLEDKIDNLEENQNKLLQIIRCLADNTGANYETCSNVLYNYDVQEFIEKLSSKLNENYINRELDFNHANYKIILEHPQSKFRVDSSSYNTLLDIGEYGINFFNTNFSSFDFLELKNLVSISSKLYDFFNYQYRDINLEKLSNFSKFLNEKKDLNKLIEILTKLNFDNFEKLIDSINESKWLNKNPENIIKINLSKVKNGEHKADLIKF